MAEQKTPPDSRKKEDRATELQDNQLDQSSGGMLRPPRATVLPPNPET